MIVRLDAKSVVYKRIKERVFSASAQGMGFPSGSVVKILPVNAGDAGLITGPGRPYLPLSPCATAPEPVFWSLGAATAQSACHNY